MRKFSFNTVTSNGSSRFQYFECREVNVSLLILSILLEATG